MNEKLLNFIICVCATILIFVWDYHKIKNGKYDMPADLDRHYTGLWRWVYNWGWMSFGMTIIKFSEFIETL